jgi:hypothetical protein
MTSLPDALTPLSEASVSDDCDELLKSLAPKAADDIAVLMART